MLNKRVIKKKQKKTGFQTGAAAAVPLLLSPYPTEGPQRDAASKRFLEIQQAYNSLMTTDEEQTVEALTAAAQKQAKQEAAAERGVDLDAAHKSVMARG